MSTALLTPAPQIRYPTIMDGLFSLVLLALPSQSVLGSLVDLGVLATALMFAIISALVLVRQLLFAMLLGE